MNLFIKLLLTILLASIVSCSSTHLKYTNLAEQIPPIPEGMARLYVLNVSEYDGLQPPPIYIDGKRALWSIDYGRFEIFDMPPRHREIMTGVKSFFYLIAERSINLDMKENKAYYVEIEFMDGLLDDNDEYRLLNVSEEQGLLDISLLKYLSSLPVTPIVLE